MIDLKATQSFAEDLARSVGRHILNRRSEIEIDAYKDRQDVVTNIDLEAEKMVLKGIREKYPKHAIYSEEAGEDAEDSEYRWVVDPIDGTKEYTRQLSNWNTSFALEYRGEPILSVVFKPVTGELFSAAKDQGSYLNGSLIQPAATTDIKDAIVYAYLPTYKVDSEVSKRSWNSLHALSRSVYRIRGLAEEAAGMGWVASGKIDACLNLSRFPEWYDFVPGFVIAKEAGCVVTDTNGSPIVREGNFSGYIVANNQEIHAKILKFINP